MGKRTRFQVKEVAQLTLNINLYEMENNTNQFTTYKCNDLPKVSN